MTDRSVATGIMEVASNLGMREGRWSEVLYPWKGPDLNWRSMKFFLKSCRSRNGRIPERTRMTALMSSEVLEGNTEFGPERMPWIIIRAFRSNTRHV